MHTYRLLLLPLLLFSSRIHCSVIFFSSPISYSEIVAGSTVSLHWVDHNINNASLFDVYLVKHEAAIMYALATNISTSLTSAHVSTPNHQTGEYTIVVLDAITKSSITTIGPVFLVHKQDANQHTIRAHTETQYGFYEAGMTLTSGQVVIISFSIIGIVLIFWVILYNFTKIERDIEHIQYVLLEKL